MERLGNSIWYLQIVYQLKFENIRFMQNAQFQEVVLIQTLYIIT